MSWEGLTISSFSQELKILRPAAGETWEERERHAELIGPDSKELKINPGGRPQQAAHLQGTLTQAEAA